MATARAAEARKAIANSIELRIDAAERRRSAAEHRAATDEHLRRGINRGDLDEPALAG